MTSSCTVILNRCDWKGFKRDDVMLLCVYSKVVIRRRVSLQPGHLCAHSCAASLPSKGLAHTAGRHYQKSRSYFRFDSRLPKADGPNLNDPVWAAVSASRPDVSRCRDRPVCNMGHTTGRTSAPEEVLENSVGWGMTSSFLRASVWKSARTQLFRIEWNWKRKALSHATLGSWVMNRREI